MLKDGKFIAEDEEEIERNLEKAVKEHERVKHQPAEEAELRRLYEEFRKNEPK